MRRMSPMQMTAITMYVLTNWRVITTISVVYNALLMSFPLQTMLNIMVTFI